MSAGLLDAIFATATVAAGVDFPARTVVITGAEARTGHGWRSLTASEMQQMTGRAGRRGRDNVGFIVAAPGLHQDPQRIAELLRAPADPLISQFRATYTSLLNLLDAFGNFAQVREIAEKSFAYRDVAGEVARLQVQRKETEARIISRLRQEGCDLPVQVSLGLERLISARARLQEAKPQTRAELMHRWLDEVVQPGRVVGIGRTGKRLVMVTEKHGENIRGIREDGRHLTLPLGRIGRVYSPVYRLEVEAVQDAFDEVSTRGRELVLLEPRLRDTQDEDTEALNVIDDLTDSILPRELAPELRQACTQALWTTIEDAEAVNRATRRIEALQEEVWRPFEQRARILASFGYLDFAAEKVTDRGKWLADLHIDRPLLVGEAIENGLFKPLDFVHLAAVMAALTADEDRDYGQLELFDSLVQSLSQFEEMGFRIATEEWKYAVEPAPDLNFSAAAATAAWATGTDWATLVHETGAEEGDLFRMLSRTGEALLQIAGLKKAHPEAARLAAIAADAVLREPVR